jgi:hypothetical protein
MLPYYESAHPSLSPLLQMEEDPLSAWDLQILSLQVVWERREFFSDVFRRPQ